MRSRDDSQNGGNNGSPSSQCEPQQYIGGQPNSSLPNNGGIVPCGLIAWSFFNDTFTVSQRSPDTGDIVPLPLDVSPPIIFCLSCCCVSPLPSQSSSCRPAGAAHVLPRGARGFFLPLPSQFSTCFSTWGTCRFPPPAQLVQHLFFHVGHVPMSFL